MYFIECVRMVVLHWSGDCVRLCGGWQNFMPASVYHKERKTE